MSTSNFAASDTEVTSVNRWQLLQECQLHDRSNMCWVLLRSLYKVKGSWGPVTGKAQWATSIWGWVSRGKLTFRNVCMLLQNLLIPVLWLVYPVVDSGTGSVSIFPSLLTKGGYSLGKRWKLLVDFSLCFVVLMLFVKWVCRPWLVLLLSPISSLKRSKW